MDGNMRVAIMEGIGKMGFTQRPIPAPREDEVLVKLKGIVSNIFPLSDIQYAMDESVRNKADIVKSVIKID